MAPSPVDLPYALSASGALLGAEVRDTSGYSAPYTLHPTRTAECLRGLSVVPNSTHVCGSVTPADGRQVKLTGCWWWQAAAAVAAGRAAAAVPGHARCRAAGAACGLQSGAACGKGRGVVQWRSTVLRAASAVHATCHTSKQWD